MRKFLSLLAVLVVYSLQVSAQTRTVTGKILDGQGNPIPFASIKVKNSNVGTSADNSGFFKLEIGGNVKTLVITSTGYADKEVPVSGEIMSVTLESTVQTIDEVIVTAGGLKAKKREEGYASTVINAAQLTKAKPVNVAAGLTAKVAGLQVNAINGGVNPTVRLVLRGNRSLLGNNTALIVIDNVIVPSELLGNLNPEDIQDINVLNGAGAAALYGSDASNGAIIVTTKKGRPGVNTVTVSNTVTFERVSFYPKLQKEFGSGWETGAYVAYENQQYGPRFDGTIRQLGRENLVTGETQNAVYSPTDEREDFWETGVTNQTDFSISSSDERSTYYISGQYASVQGTTPKDRYNRASIRFNGTRKVTRNLRVAYSTNYVQNRYNITSQTSTIYNNLLNTPAQVPLSRYKNWQTDFFASPEGYYNDYYQNPYFFVDNWRSKTRNDYLTGNIEFTYEPLHWLELVYRAGLSTRNNDGKSTVGTYTYSMDDYHTGSKADVTGSVSESMFYSTQINSDFQAIIRKNIKDVSFNLTLGHALRINRSKSIDASVSGLVIEDVFNIGHRLPEFPNASSGESESRQLGIYGKLKIGYQNWLYVDVTGRNDWRSVLDPEHRSFFYPSADISFIPTDAFEFLRNSKMLDMLKLRAGWSKVGNVNIGPYSLLPTFGPASGYPFPSGPGYGVGDRIVAPAIKPEITTGVEAGFDMEMMNRRLTAGLTWYSTKTVDQTVPTGVSSATGFSSYLRNTGEVSNEGIEALLHYDIIKTQNLLVRAGGNYTYNNNKVLSISADIERLQLSTGGSAQVYANKGFYFPVLMGTDYHRDPQGRIIVDRITGYPSLDPTIRVLGNTNPKHRVGLDLEVSYKGWRFWALAEYRGGYYVYHNGGSTMDFSGSSIRTVAFNRDRFVMPNSSYEDPNKPGEYIANTNIQVLDGGSGFWADGAGDYNMDVATNYLVKGDFWKIRELSISYDFPTSLLAKTKAIKGASISIQGRNLFLWTPKSNIYTDPEYNFSDGNAIGITTLAQSPPSRYFGGTITLTF
jgi:TonB-linked SusC/RagA family outer membrane protein